jgi:hypothetical protein
MNNTGIRKEAEHQALCTFFCNVSGDGLPGKDILDSYDWPGNDEAFLMLYTDKLESDDGERTLSVWEPFESYPCDWLLRHATYMADAFERAMRDARDTAVKKLGEAIERGDPLEIVDLWLQMKGELK